MTSVLCRLSCAIRRYYATHENVDVEAIGPVFQLCPLYGVLEKVRIVFLRRFSEPAWRKLIPPLPQVRYNESDRKDLTYMTTEDAAVFYEHLSVLVEIMRRKSLLYETEMPEVCMSYVQSCW
mgnify:CR=1 FL=1